MADALIWNGSESGVPVTSFGGRLLTDGEGSLLYKPDGPFTGDTQLIRQGPATEPLLGDDIVKGYWLDTTLNLWRPVPLSGFSQAALDGVDFPVIVLADGRIVHGRSPGGISGGGSVIDLWIFDPATYAWTKYGDPFVSNFAYVGWLDGEPVIAGKFVTGSPLGALRWDGAAWVTHSDPGVSLGLSLAAVLGFKLIGGVPTMFGAFKRASDNKTVAAIGWNGFAWTPRSNWSSSSPTAADMIFHNGLIYYLRAGGSQIRRINADGTETGFNTTPSFGTTSGSIFRLASFNGGLYVLGKFDEFTVQFNDSGPASTLSVSNIARITLEPPGVFDVGGGLQRGTSPFDPNFHQLIVQGGKLWVGSRFMDAVNNGAQTVPYDLAAWDGAAWTIPPAAPKGGWTGFGRVITPGDPF